MRSKHNSLIYKELVKNMGKYFFGPNGKVTEKYKFLNDYYKEKEFKIGLNNKISAGTLDYFSLLSNYDSYTQRLNSTKEQMLFSSHNLSVARSGFDVVGQNALSKNKLFNKNKNFVNLNIKNVKNFYRNYTNSNIDSSKKNYQKIIIPKIKINNNENINHNNIKFSKVKSSLLKKNENNLSKEFSCRSISPNNTILERYSNESIIKELKQKLNYLDPNNYLPLSLSQNKLNLNKRSIKFLPEINIKENLSQRIKPIIYLNRNSIIDLSFLKNFKINSKNNRNAKRLIERKNMKDRFFDQSDFSYPKLPSLQSISLSKRREKLINKNNYMIDYN